MLTWSDWRTEPRSNRYHYASRFARHLPVYFLQVNLPDAEHLQIVSEPTELAQVTLWRTSSGFTGQAGELQRAAFLKQLKSVGARKPLLWIYNYGFDELLSQLPSFFKIYHATEDYVGSRFPGQLEVSHLHRTLGLIDLLVGVSEGIVDVYHEAGGYRGPAITLLNGVDYQFYRPQVSDVPPPPGRPDVVLFQGGINHRLDFEMIRELIDRLDDCLFYFCGSESNAPPLWDEIKSHPRVKYWGALAAEEVRRLCHQATVGIIPYVQRNIDGIRIDLALPIKAFEYVACGLPVVSIPMKRLEAFDVFTFATDAASFAREIRAVAPTRHEPALLSKRDESARKMDYDERFRELEIKVESTLLAKQNVKRRILILYDDVSMKISTIREHIESYAKHSEHAIYYGVATHNATLSYNLNLFDVVVLHYSIRVSLTDHLSAAFPDAIAAFPGLKVLYIQDEYDTTEVARRWIERLGIDLVFTCVPEAHIEDVYPQSRFPHVKFKGVLTGSVPESYAELEASFDTKSRPVLIGYRGRPLPYWYGDLGQEKMRIGVEMKAICEKRGLPVDIEWSNEARIYGDKWYQFVRSCRAMLGTESGSNVFDFDGTISKTIRDAILENPELTYDEAFGRFIAPHEGKIKQNQISPKIFEAIAFRTGLILFEGEYSKVVVPWEHYIPLKKDFSNIDEVLSKVQDDAFMEAMVERAYRDVIASGKYSYREFIASFDKDIEASVTGIPCRLPMINALIAVGEPQGPRSLGTLVAQAGAAGVGDFENVVSSKFLPTNTPLPSTYVDILPPLPKVEPVVIRETVVVTRVETPEPIDVIRSIRAKQLVRELLRRIWRRVPRPLKVAGRPFMRMAKALVRTIWR